MGGHATGCLGSQTSVLSENSFYATFKFLKISFIALKSLFELLGSAADRFVVEFWLGKVNTWKIPSRKAINDLWQRAFRALR